jgi:hypothetical protein
VIPSSRTLKLALAFAIGETVHLRTRPETLAGIVTGVIVRPAALCYVVAWGDATESNHYDFELAAGLDDDGQT